MYLQSKFTWLSIIFLKIKQILECKKYKKNKEKYYKKKEKNGRREREIIQISYNTIVICIYYWLFLNKIFVCFFIFFFHGQWTMFFSLTSLFCISIDIRECNSWNTKKISFNEKSVLLWKFAANIPRNMYTDIDTEDRKSLKAQGTNKVINSRIA